MKHTDTHALLIAQSAIGVEGGCMHQLPDIIRAALAPFAPAASSVQFTEDELIAADRAQERWKAGFHERNEARAIG